MNIISAARFRMAVFFVCSCAIAGLDAKLHADDGPDQLPFSGKSLDGWMTQDGKPVTEGWVCEDGMIHLKKMDHRIGAILTKRELGDFILSFEWKISKGGNSGIKYRVKNYSSKGKRLYGLEYQVLDDLGYKNQPVLPRYRTGAIYDVYPPDRSKILLPVGEFNHSKIVLQNNQVEHWLNGQQVVSATIGSPDWLKRVKKSKFNDLHDFGLNQCGRIMLTDHGAEVWYRNFEFTSLSSGEISKSSEAVKGLPH